MQFKPPNLERLDEYQVVAVDVETTGKHWYRDRMFGVAIAALTDTQDVRSAYWDIREKPHILKVLRDKLPMCKRVVNHNMKFDAHFLQNEDVILPRDRIECTSVRAALIDEHEPNFSLDNLSLRHLKRGKVNIHEKLADLFGGKPTREAQIGNLHRAPVEIAAEYAIWDPVLAIWLWQWQEIEIAKQGLDRIWSLEKRVTPILWEIERNGIRVDVERTVSSQSDIDAKIEQAKASLAKLAGREVNVNSSPQMHALFGVKKQGERWYTDTDYPLIQTDGGKASIDADALRDLVARGDERAKAAHSIRKLVKAKSFLTNHILEHEIDGRVYPNYNQTRGDNDLGTGTGRFSIDDPAMQQIPKRDEEIAAIVRSCFLPEQGQDWACGDWDQFEFRWFAHYVKSPKINAVYADKPDADFHQMLADLTGLPRTAKFAGQSANAKQINLGLVFGMGQGRMAAEMGLPHTIQTRQGVDYFYAGPEAEAIFAQYHDAVPGVKELLAQASSIAKSRGYVETIHGRHIRFPHGKFTHKAAGLVFQGSSADCMKQKMIELHNQARIDKDWRLLLSVHDELDSSVPKKGRGEKIVAMQKDYLQTFDGERCPIACRIPIRTSINIGPNWWEACK